MLTGEQLKNKLLARGKTLADIARALEITPQSLNDRFKTDDPKHSFVMNVLQAAELTLDDLYSGRRVSKNVLGPTPDEMELQAKYLACVEAKAAALERIVELQDQLAKSQQSPALPRVAH